VNCRTGSGRAAVGVILAVSCNPPVPAAVCAHELVLINNEPSKTASTAIRVFIIRKS
jgi:hypothetical protein